MRAGQGARGGAVAFPAGSRSRDTSSGDGLALTVIFTTRRATRAALEEADRLARGLGARIRLVVADAIPYHAPVGRGSGPVDVPCGLLNDLLTGLRTTVRVELYRCRDTLPALRELLPPKTTSLIGTGGFWSRRRERRLAAFLASLGHEVLEVSSDSGRDGVSQESALDVNEYG